MITIRYADLPEGLHAQAERQGRRTVIYLRPGLTAEQRRLGLRRARQSARMGYGPRLPAAGVVQAVARDSIRGTLGTVGAVLRRHPLGSILLAAGLAAVVSSYALFVTGSIRLVLHTSPGHAASAGPHPAAAHPRANPGPGPGGYPAPAPPGSPWPSPHDQPRERAGHGHLSHPAGPGSLGYRQRGAGAFLAGSVGLAGSPRTLSDHRAARRLRVTGAPPVTCTGWV